MDFKTDNETLTLTEAGLIKLENMAICAEDIVLLITDVMGKGKMDSNSRSRIFILIEKLNQYKNQI